MAKVSDKSKPHSHLSCGSGFIQVKAKFLLDAWLDLVRPNASAMLWIWLNARCTRKNVAHMNEKRMLAEIRFSKTALYKGLRELQARNFIWRDDEGKSHLNKDMFWHGRIAASVFSSRCYGDPKPLKPKVIRKAEVA